MKSLVEEASSVSKAIEKAWLRAGKPVSFSIKIYEEAQSGFLGFNSKPAKVGIFFDDHAQSKQVNGDSRRRQSPTAPREESSRPQQPQATTQGERQPQERRSDDRRDNRRSDDRRSDDRRDNRSGGDSRRNGGRDRNFNRRDRGPRSDSPRTFGSESAERRDPVNAPRVEDSHPVETHPAPQQAVQPQSQQSSQRRVLKVSSRRYIAPTQEAQTSSAADIAPKSDE